MRLFYSSDIHGSERCWRKFLNASKFYNADVLVLGGDITGKILVPIVEERPGHFTAQVFGRTERVSNGSRLEKLEGRVRFNGFYPFRCSQADYERLATDPAWLEKTMSEVILHEISHWMSIADEKLVGTGVRCFVMAGNDDPWEVDSVIGSDTVENPDGSVVEFGGYQLLSSSWANPTPWDSPREVPDSEFADILDELADQLVAGRPAIFNLHAPPFDSGLDSAPELDEDLGVKRIGGQENPVPVGSRAVRKVIEDWQPLLALHGHIHESRFVARIGETICVNPGSRYVEGVIDGVLVDLDGDNVTNYQLVSG